MTKEFKGLLDLLEYFQDEATCYRFMEQQRWGDTPICPHCKSIKVYRLKDGKRFCCGNKECERIFNVKIGTVMENTKVPLKKWFAAIYLITSHKKGISSIQLSKDIHVTQKTAWFMLHRIREMMKEKSKEPMSGVIEVDETYVGGKEKNKPYHKRNKGTQGRSTKFKIGVFGIMRRGGYVRSMSVGDVKSKTLIPIIKKNVRKGETIMSDEWKSYRQLSKNFNHKFCNHAAYQYVKDDCYTNTLEGYWSLIKRSILGIYHWISRKHIDRYLHEYDLRYNLRLWSEGLKFYYVVSECEGRLKYRDLIA